MFRSVGPLVFVRPEFKGLIPFVFVPFISIFIGLLRGGVQGEGVHLLESTCQLEIEIQLGDRYHYGLDGSKQGAEHLAETTSPSPWLSYTATFLLSASVRPTSRRTALRCANSLRTV